MDGSAARRRWLQGDAAAGGIPKGGLFTIYGSELAPREAKAPSVPLSTTLSTVRVRISAATSLGIRDFYAPLHYVAPGQVNAVMPSGVPAGRAELRVVVNSVPSEPVDITVVDSRFAAFTSGGLGFGPALLQQYDSAGGVAVNRFRSPARPGNVLVLWGTGLGAIEPGDDAAPPGGNLRNDVTIHIGGTSIKPAYAGRAPGLPGVDQINFALPESVPEGCFVPLQVTVGSSDLGQLVFSAAAAGDSCTSEFNHGPENLTKLDEGKTIRVAVLSYSADPSKTEQQTLEAWAAEYDASRLSLLTSPTALPTGSAAACQQRAYSRTRFESPSDERGPLYGWPLDSTALTLRVSGKECAWNSVSGVSGVIRPQTNATCVATAAELAVTAAGQPVVVAESDLPAVRNTAIRQFTSRLVSQAVQTSWQLGSSADRDLATVTIGSSFTLQGSIFSGLTNYRQVSCRIPASLGGFSFTREQTGWARGLQNSTPASLQIADDRAGAVDPDSGELGAKTIDVIVVRTRNGASATAQE